jgi:hypothetical protein
MKIIKAPSFFSKLYCLNPATADFINNKASRQQVLTFKKTGKTL